MQLKEPDTEYHARPFSEEDIMSHLGGYRVEGKRGRLWGPAAARAVCSTLGCAALCIATYNIYFSFAAAESSHPSWVGAATVGALFGFLLSVFDSFRTANQ